MGRTILFLIVFFVACDKGINPNADLDGSWQWIESSGGFAGQTLSPASTGEEVIIEFDKRKYFRYVNGDLVDDLKYKIISGESIYSTEPGEIIEYSSGWKQSYMVSGDTLYLLDECFDCYGHAYIRQ